MYYEGRSLPEAVLALTGDGEALDPPRYPPGPGEEEKAEFVLPPKAKSYRRLFGYLCKTRGLDTKTVNRLIQEKLLYEGVTEAKGREYHSAVFVYYGPDGEPVGAFRRGLSSKAPFKLSVPGSDKKYGWLFRGYPGCRCVGVFEAAIDAASDYSLTGNRSIDRLSLEGLDPDPLRNYLARHPETETILLMLDKDQWGQKAAGQLREEFQKQYRVLVQPPPVGKDYNEYLLYQRENQQALNHIERGDKHEQVHTGGVV